MSASHDQGMMPQLTKGRGPRRLSSLTATSDEMAAGPITIAPENELHAPSKAHETAAALEIAKRNLGYPSSGIATPDTPKETVVTDQYAFAFDIDGVLIRGGKPIPEAIEAMKVLNGENEYGIKVPYIFVTNGGGKTEQERCLQLSRQLELEVSPGQFICGHTPMREMAARYEKVLIVGGEGDACRAIAEAYGFRDVVIPGDIIADNSETTPFRTLTVAERAHSRARNFHEVEIEAIFVFADSRDWAGDQQIILDLLLSEHGRLGTRAAPPFGRGPPLYFAHSDVVWATAHDFTRLGMGALRESLAAMYKAITGEALATHAFGKPQLETFHFATRLLQQWRKETHALNAPPATVYFVGDTPESDIRGANAADEAAHDLATSGMDAAAAPATEWYSILVETGVHQRGTMPRFAPKATVPTVLEAVRHGIRREAEKATAQCLAVAAKNAEVVVEE